MLTYKQFSAQPTRKRQQSTDRDRAGRCRQASEKQATKQNDGPRSITNQSCLILSACERVGENPDQNPIPKRHTYSYPPCSSVSRARQKKPAGARSLDLARHPPPPLLLSLALPRRRRRTVGGQADAHVCCLVALLGFLGGVLGCARAVTAIEDASSIPKLPRRLASRPPPTNCPPNAHRLPLLAAPDPSPTTRILNRRKRTHREPPSIFGEGYGGRALRVMVAGGS